MAERQASGWRGNVAALIVATGISLYAGEAFLYWWDRTFVDGLPVAEVQDKCPGPASTDRRCLEAIRLGEPFDPRTSLEVFNQRAAEGDTIWPAVPARAFEPDEGLPVPGEEALVRPLAGISGVETLLCNESGQWVTYAADEHGLNNPSGIHDRGDVAVAVVGDSFVHGWCVPRPQTIGGLLDARWGPVVNLGLEAGGPLSQLGLLREYGASLEPPVVLWHFFAENDPGDLEREARDAVLRSYLDPGFRQGLKGRQALLDHGLKGYILEVRREDDERARARARRARELRLGRDHPALAWMKLQRLRGRVGSLFSERRDERRYPWDEALLTRVLSRAKSDVEAWGGRLVFVYLPAWRRIVPRQGATPHKEEILAAVEALGIPVVDPTPAFLAHPEPERLFPFGLDGHYSVEGFELLSREVDAYLEASSMDGAGPRRRP